MLPSFDGFQRRAVKPARLRRNGGLHDREALARLPNRFHELRVESFR
jgi:hypothetical protein